MDDQKFRFVKLSPLELHNSNVQLDLSNQLFQELSLFIKYLRKHLYLTLTKIQDTNQYDKILRAIIHNSYNYGKYCTKLILYRTIMKFIQVIDQCRLKTTNQEKIKIFNTTKQYLLDIYNKQSQSTINLSEILVYMNSLSNSLIVCDANSQRIQTVPKRQKESVNLMQRIDAQNRIYNKIWNKVNYQNYNILKLQNNHHKDNFRIMLSRDQNMQLMIKDSMNRNKKIKQQLDGWANIIAKNQRRFQRGMFLRKLI